MKRTPTADLTTRTESDEVFADPVAFLAAHGISAKLVEVRVDPGPELATAA